MGQKMDHVQPKPGDLIEIFCGTNQHWAIYVGDGHVIHLVPATCGSSNSMSVLPVVKKDNLCHVVGTSTFRINNLLDDKYKPKSVNTILMNALSHVDQTLPYDVARYSCEHFVTNLRYGMPEFRQVRDASVNVGICATVTSCILSCIYGLGGICKCDCIAGYDRFGSEMNLNIEDGGSA